MKTITNEYHQQVIARLASHPKYERETDRGLACVVVSMFSGYDQKLRQQPVSFLEDISALRKK